MEVVLKVVALVELVALVTPLSVGQVVPSCGGTKVNDNRKISSGYSRKLQHNTTQHNREKTRTIHTANRNTTGKRQEHNMNRNTTQRNTTGRTQHDKTQELHGKIRSKNAAHLPEILSYSKVCLRLLGTAHT